MNKKFTFITVNYKNTYYTHQLVDSLTKLEGFSECQVVIVDNESSDKTKTELEKLKMKYPNNISIFYVSDNLYYWRGASFGINKVHSDKNNMPDWVIVCNNDILIEQKDFLKKLNSFGNKKYGVIAPAIISSKTGKDQNPFRINPLSRKEQLKWALFCTNYYIAKLMLFCKDLLVLLKLKSNHKKNSFFEQKIYAPHGSFVIFSKVFFERGGYLDSNFDLYGEENTTAEIAKRIGLPVYYCPFLKVLHCEHSSTGMKFTKQKYYKGKTSYRYFCREYLSR
ncbi:MAG: glycosyltransferase [bacterium]|nr:glycosyltransferase [bacterium]